MSFELDVFFTFSYKIDICAAMKIFWDIKCTWYFITFITYI